MTLDVWALLLLLLLLCTELDWLAVEKMKMIPRVKIAAQSNQTSFTSNHFWRISCHTCYRSSRHAKYILMIELSLANLVAIKFLALQSKYWSKIKNVIFVRLIIHQLFWNSNCFMIAKGKLIKRREKAGRNKLGPVGSQAKKSSCRWRLLMAIF